MSCEWIRANYDVPACVGRRIRYSAKSGVQEGTICRGSNYIAVNFDDDKPGRTINIHPTDPGLEYLGMGKIRKMTRSQQRYQDYLNADCCESFSEWMGFRSKENK